MNILIRNLARNIDEKSLEKLFSPFGTITDYCIVLDEQTGKSKGFGFVDMPNETEAKEAIKNLNGQKIDDERIRVKKAQGVFKKK
jgi:RNA recognition motif-containing protein